ncbi:hypothetical protein NBRC116583_39050 [Arenicella sp. 4NH20-0111]
MYFYQPPVETSDEAGTSYIELPREQKFMAEQFRLANFCETSYDCVNVGTYCGVGCEVFVNSKAVKDIKVLMSKFPPSCVNDCMGGNAKAVCKNNKCVEIKP